jgi:hypothetical protein
MSARVHSVATVVFVASLVPVLACRPFAPDASRNAGAACTEDAECSSQACGQGYCCSEPCSDAEPCGTKTCASGTGACQYPMGTPCDAGSCFGSMLTTYTQCDGQGRCMVGGTSGPCMGGFQCETSMACYTSCQDGGECMSGYYCDDSSHTACKTKLMNGIDCTADSQCLSNVCGVNGMNGMRKCCQTQCQTSDPTCGATGCDSSGMCVYPDSSVSCERTCADEPSTSTSAMTVGSCNMGNCSSPNPKSCGNYKCNMGKTDCLTECRTDKDCWTGGCTNKNCN